MRKLPESLRLELRRPFGKVLSNEELISALKNRKGMLITIGDDCSYSLIKAGIMPDIVVYDLRIKRRDVIGSVRDALSKFDDGEVIVHNQAGVIMDELVESVKYAIEKGMGKILVKGEEDLAALVAMMYAPDGALIVYGQPDEGAVLVKMDEEARDRAVRAFESMEE
ncbi:MAG: DUF359 domain-containing protein [Candidatus Micrarchaeota archaeon]|nr:DUF359 domain-containing protein [Candidatus Micrarchaeota archaeon]